MSCPKRYPDPDELLDAQMSEEEMEHLDRVAAAIAHALAEQDGMCACGCQQPLAQHEAVLGVGRNQGAYHSRCFARLTAGLCGFRTRDLRLVKEMS